MNLEGNMDDSFWDIAKNTLSAGRSTAIELSRTLSSTSQEISAKLTEINKSGVCQKAVSSFFDSLACTIKDTNRQLLANMLRKEIKREPTEQEIDEYILKYEKGETETQKALNKLII